MTRKDKKILKLVRKLNKLADYKQDNYILCYKLSNGNIFGVSYYKLKEE